MKNGKSMEKLRVFFRYAAKPGKRPTEFYVKFPRHLFLRALAMRFSRLLIFPTRQTFVRQKCQLF